MQKTKIEWADYVFNPIKGLCPMDCKRPDGKSYCYARQFYKRFKFKEGLSFIFDEPAWGIIEKLQRFNPPVGSKIFLCSTMELFHPLIKKEWRDLIFEIIEKNKKYIWIILTKLPENINRPMPENVWLGVTVTSKIDEDRLRFLKWIEVKTKFVSFEPLFGDVAMKGWNIFPVLDYRLSWVIIGRLTGFGNKWNPTKANIKCILDVIKEQKIPVFMKDNLRPIMGDKLIQQWPE